MDNFRSTSDFWSIVGQMTTSARTFPVHSPPAVVYAAREVAARRLQSQVVRLRHNRYVLASEWTALDRQGRRILGALAAALELPGSVLSHGSAAALLGIPMICAPLRKAEVTVGPTARNRGHEVLRHRSQTEPAVFAAAAMDSRPELVITTPAQTAIDIARLYPLPTALAALDHVLHNGQANQEELAACLEAVPTRGRGKDRARTALAIADGRSESPGESLSRARLFENGYPKPELQHEVHDAAGSFLGRVDFKLGGRLLGEFDGRSKYQRVDRDPAAATAEGEVVWREKKREDGIRRQGWDMARWTWQEAFRFSELEKILAEHGHFPTGEPWF